MQKKLIAVAVMALLGQSAFAATAQTTFADAQAAQNAGRIIYLAGASATKASFEGAFKKLCDTYLVAGVPTSTENLFVWKDSTASTGNVRAYACRLLPAASLTALGFPELSAWGGLDIVVDHSVFNGSLTSILSMDSNPANQNPQIDFNSGLVAGTTINEIVSAPKHRAAGGLSDVEANLFKDVLATTSFADSSVKTSLVVSPTSVGQSFGIVVSRKLYEALQAKEIAAGTMSASCTGDNITAACQPNVTRTQYASIVNSNNAGNITDWQILGLGASPDGTVRIARRDIFSGTQASSNNYFLGRICSTAGQDPAAAADSNGTLIVTEGATTGNALTVLGDNTTWAIGVASLENKAVAGPYNAVLAPSTAKSQWRFVKLDGVAISDDTNTVAGSVGNGKHRQASIDMQYGFNFETTVNTSSNTAITSAKAGELLLGLVKLMGDPSVTDLVGLYVLPNADSGPVYTNSTNPTQVAKAVRGGNSCQAASYIYF